ncbi:hypothetical protein QBC40DRAFT_301192 [Triangularia verruculosa]|uniref:Uncharacterized protein n=1 Tax=Triangularia verruculosa TaxID=2587418 RepID=A0AAN6X9E4_9PEZI|nr:hypothetical protein QBC40DRAFT_301192 [Triangularia verruculosa]
MFATRSLTAHATDAPVRRPLEQINPEQRDNKENLPPSLEEVPAHEPDLESESDIEYEWDLDYSPQPPRLDLSSPPSTRVPATSNYRFPNQPADRKLSSPPSRSNTSTNTSLVPQRPRRLGYPTEARADLPLALEEVFDVENLHNNFNLIAQCVTECHTADDRVLEKFYERILWSIMDFKSIAYSVLYHMISSAAREEKFWINPRALQQGIERLQQAKQDLIEEQGE